MDKTFYEEARGLSVYLNNLARDYERDGFAVAKDMREASLTIKILLNNIEMLRNNIRKMEE